MGTSERRYKIMKLLCRRRYETTSNLALEFGVSERTIQRDIEILSRTEPIFTKAGKYTGGVYVVDNYSMDRMYMSSTEISLLHKAYTAIQSDDLFTNEEKILFKHIINEYTKPSKNNLNKENILWQNLKRNFFF